MAASSTQRFPLAFSKKNTPRKQQLGPSIFRIARAIDSLVAPANKAPASMIAPVFSFVNGFFYEREHLTWLSNLETANRMFQDEIDHESVRSHEIVPNRTRGIVCFAYFIKQELTHLKQKTPVVVVGA